MTARAIRLDDERERGELSRWTLAGLVMLAAHAGIVATYMLLHRPNLAASGAPVVLVELAPVPAAAQKAVDVPTETVQSLVPPDPDVRPVEPEPRPVEQARPIEPEVKPPDPQMRPVEPEVKPPDQVRTVEPVKVDPLPPDVVAEVVTALLTPPEQPRQETKAAPEKPVEKKPEKPAREPPHKKPAARKTAVASAPSQAAAPAAPRLGPSPQAVAAAQASWRDLLVAHLQRNKRYPGGAQARHEQGTVVLSFSMDRNGRVLGRSIARSSGVAELDQEVLAMIMRAQPLPPFPPSMPQARMTLTVPIRFSLR